LLGYKLDVSQTEACWMGSGDKANEKALIEAVVFFGSVNMYFD
jgi:hypothetical protein